MTRLKISDIKGYIESYFNSFINQQYHSDLILNFGFAHIREGLYIDFANSPTWYCVDDYENWQNVIPSNTIPSRIKSTVLRYAIGMNNSFKLIIQAWNTFNSGYNKEIRVDRGGTRGFHVVTQSGARRDKQFAYPNALLSQPDVAYIAAHTESDAVEDVEDVTETPNDFEVTHDTDELAKQAFRDKNAILWDEPARLFLQMMREFVYSGV